MQDQELHVRFVRLVWGGKKPGKNLEERRSKDEGQKTAWQLLTTAEG